MTISQAPNALWVLAKGTKARVFTLPNSIRYDYTGAIQTFTVPDDVTTITIEAHGAAGGTISSYPGGNGGKVAATFDVIPGAVYDVYVGGKPAGTPAAAAGGWPNGGLGDTGASGLHGAGGGGRSEVRATGDTLANTLIVAGAGGGSGEGGSTPDAHGGAAGLYAGLNGGDGSFGIPATGATIDGVGIGGGNTTASNGLNPGGGPAAHTTGAFAFSGGGGGDGYYGGGGASTGGNGFGTYAGGGAGGVGWVGAGATDVEYTDAENSGAGFVIISWADPLPV